MIKCAMKCTESDDEFNKKMFPKNNSQSKEIFEVNFPKTSQYYNSTIPQCQRLLNETFFMNKKHRT